MLGTPIEPLSAPGSAPSPRAELLLIHDSVAELRPLEDLLQRHGYHVCTVSSGAGLVPSLSVQPPDVVLFDVRAPSVDVRPAYQQLKSDPTTALIPVLFLSAADAPGETCGGFRTGGAGLNSEVLGEAELVERIDAQVSLGRLRRSLAADVKERTRAERAKHEQLLRAEALTLQLRARVEGLLAVNEQLSATLKNVKRLNGLLAVCSYCRKLRDDDGCWQHLEKYLNEHTDAMVTHGICPECIELYFGADDDG